MSFVVMMVGPATIDPALDPTYGMPSPRRERIACRRSVTSYISTAMKQGN